MSEFLLNTQAEKVLTALAHFAYLTTEQMIDLRISTNRNSLNENTLKPLAEMKSPLIHRRSYYLEGKRKSYLYKLTPKGAKLIADVHGDPDVSGVKFHKEEIKVKSGYAHRVAQSDFHIAFARWIEATQRETDFFWYDYELIGAPRYGEAESRTQARFKGKTKKPDMITRYHDGDKTRLLAVEIHNGKDTKRVFQQLLEYVPFLEQSVFEQKFGHGTAMFIASVHEHENTLKGAKERLLQQRAFEPLKPLFVFNLQSQVKADFVNGWTLADGGKTALF